MSDSNKPSKKVKPSQILLFCKNTFVDLPLLAILIGLAGVFFTALTPFGRTYVSNLALQAIPEPENFTLEVDELTSPRLGQWQIKNIKVTTQQGLIFSSQSVNLEWSILKALTGKLLIAQFSADQVNVYLKPDVSNQKTKTKEIESAYFLSGLDQKVNRFLTQSANRIIPIEIKNIQIEKFSLHKNNERQWSHKIIGQGVIGGRQLFVTQVILSNIDHTPIFTQVSNQQVDVKNIQLSASMTYQSDLHTEIKSHIQSAAYGPVDAQIQMITHLNQAPFQIDLQNGEIKNQDHKLSLEGLAFLSSEEQTLKINQLFINSESKVLNGQLALSGDITPKQIDLKIEVNPLNIKHKRFKTDIELNGFGQVIGPIDKLLVEFKPFIQGKIIEKKLSTLLNLRLEAGDLFFNTDQLTLDESIAQTQGQWNFKDKTLELQAKVQALHLSDLSQFNIKLPKEIDLILDQADLNLSFAMQPKKALQPKKLLIEGQATAQGKLWNIPVQDLTTSLQITESSLELLNAKATSTHASLDATGKVNWKENSIDLALNAANVDTPSLAWLPFDIPQHIRGNLRGQLLFQGPLKSINLSLHLTGPLSIEALQLDSNCKLKTNFKSLDFVDCLLQPNKGLVSNTNQRQLLADSSPQIQIDGAIDFSPLNIQVISNFNLYPIEDLLKLYPDLIQFRNLFQTTGLINGQVEYSQNINNPNRLKLNLGFFGESFSKTLYGGLRANIKNIGTQTQAIQVDSFGLDFGNSSNLTFNGFLNDQTLASTLKLSFETDDFQNLPIPGLELFNKWPGEIKFFLEASGPVNQPALNGELNYIAEMKGLNTKGITQIIPIEINTGFSQALNQSFKLKGSLEQQGSTTSHFTLSSQAIGLKTLQQKDFSFSTQGHVELTSLNDLINPVFHQFAGQLNWDISFENPFAMQGILSLDNGYYEHLAYGTRFQEAQIELGLNQQGIEVIRGKAKDEDSGQYEISGQYTWPWIQANKTNLQVDLNEVLLINRPDIESKAKGRISLISDFKDHSKTDHSKTPSSLILKGGLQLQPLTIHLDRSTNDGVPSIDIERVNRKFQPQTLITSNQAAVSQPDRPIKFDISIEAKQQAFLRGKGINAELEGALSIQGDQMNPIVSGQMRVIRGDADILGKRFKINNGLVRLNDNQALLSFLAVHVKGTQTFEASVNGTLANLEVSLTSSPALPEDETMSQLLFGKALNEVTAVQALRIAAAIRSLSQPASGLNPLDKTRDLLGVDQVRIDSEKEATGEENYSLGVGKYISDRVYLEIERSSDPVEPWQGRIEIELTPNISLETSAESQSGLSGIDLQWKRDY